MGPQLIFFVKALVRRCIDGPNRSCLVLAVTNVDALIRRVITQVINIAVEVDLFDEVKGSSIVDVQFSLAARGKDFVGFRGKNHTLWIRNSRDGTEYRSRADIDDLDRIVSQRKNKYPVSRGTKVIDTSLYALQRNRLGQDQRARDLSRRTLLSIHPDRACENEH